VVTHDLPAGVIAAGAPAKVIREIEFRKPGVEKPPGQAES
jgi:acetyltransferase-like isoleucine patch superfamily enzyme